MPDMCGQELRTDCATDCLPIVPNTTPETIEH